MQIHYYNSWKVEALEQSLNLNQREADKNHSSPTRKLFSNAFVRNISASSVFQYFSGGTSNQMTNGAGSANSQSQIFNSTSNIINNQANARGNSVKTNLINSLNNNNNTNNNNDLMIEDLMQLFSVVNIRIQKV